MKVLEVHIWHVKFGLLACCYQKYGSWTCDTGITRDPAQKYRILGLHLRPIDSEFAF